MQNLKYKLLARGTLRVVRLKYRKRKVSGNVLNEPCVYLCRHRDMIGVVQAFSDIRTVLRPWVLNCFCSYREAKAQLENYTFSKRLKKGKVYCSIMSSLCGRVITAYVKNVQGIPVYRGEDASKSILTIKQSVRALEENQSIVIFVDVDYADENERDLGEIYKGFYAVDKLYYRRNKKHLPFVPVYANNTETVIHAPLYFSDNNRESVFEKVAQGIYNKVI
ncbi:MAG: hypothetical protein J6C23_04365 [Clostridia bacterium]|nr:hypothetical protein [Clostridia bacterium]